MPRMISLCSAYQNASNDIHFDLEVTLRSRDLRSTCDLHFMSSYAPSDVYQREDFDDGINYALASLVKQLLAKNSIVLKYHYFEFFDPCDVIFDLT